jgi:hypothetical protein
MAHKHRTAQPQGRTANRPGSQQPPPLEDARIPLRTTTTVGTRCKPWKPGRLIGDSPDTRGSLTGDNIHTLGSASAGPRKLGPQQPSDDGTALHSGSPGPRSSQQVLRVVLDPVLFQQLPEFLLEVPAQCSGATPISNWRGSDKSGAPYRGAGPLQPSPGGRRPPGSARRPPTLW